LNDQDRFLLYTAPDGAIKIDVFIKGETVWLTQKALAELFGVQRPAITKHLSNIFSTKELEEDSVCSILEHTAADGKSYSSKYYNLDAIVAVGYRVNSYQATQFRIWATKILREFIIKGFAIDDERLKQGTRRRGEREKKSGNRSSISDKTSAPSASPRATSSSIPSAPSASPRATSSIRREI